MTTAGRRDLSGPWPLPRRLIERELEGYLEAASHEGIGSLPTRCPPWTVSDLTAHLTMTFGRFADLLERSRRGDLAPPFAVADLSAKNLRAVENFAGDPISELSRQARRFLDQARDPDELMAHQFGLIPVGLQSLFGLNELAIHRADLEDARAASYRPSSQVIALLVPMWNRVLGGLPGGDDDWQRILTASGR